MKKILIFCPYRYQKSSQILLFIINKNLKIDRNILS